MDLFENTLIPLPAGANKEGAETWSLGAAGISGQDEEGGQLTEIMNSSTLQLDAQSRHPAVKGDPDNPDVNGRARKRRPPSEARLAQNAKAQKRYRYVPRTLNGCAALVAVWLWVNPGRVRVVQGEAEEREKAALRFGRGALEARRTA